jgi:hypothetical protein
MATAEQRARRRAQRETAKSVKAFARAKREGREPPRRLPIAVTKQAREAATKYGHRVLNGEDPYPAKRTAEGNQLARLASLASHGKADPAFIPAFQQYWYHYKEHEPDEADEEYEYDEDEDEDE